MEVRFHYTDPVKLSDAFAMQITPQDLRSIGEYGRLGYEKFFAFYPAFNSPEFAHKTCTKKCLRLGWAPLGPHLILDEVALIHKLSPVCAEGIQKTDLLATSERRLLLNPQERFTKLLSSVEDCIQTIDLYYDHPRHQLHCDVQLVNGQKLAQQKIQRPENMQDLAASLVCIIAPYSLTVQHHAQEFWEHYKPLLRESTEAVRKAMSTCDTTFGVCIGAREHFWNLPGYPRQWGERVKLRAKDVDYVDICNVVETIARIRLSDGNILMSPLEAIQSGQEKILQELEILQKAADGHEVLEKQGLLPAKLPAPIPILVSAVPGQTIDNTPKPRNQTLPVCRYDWDSHVVVYPLHLVHHDDCEIRIAAGADFPSTFEAQLQEICQTLQKEQEDSLRAAQGQVFAAIQDMQYSRLGYVIARCVQRQPQYIFRNDVVRKLCGLKIKPEHLTYLKETPYDGTLHYTSESEILDVLRRLQDAHVLHSKPAGTTPHWGHYYRPAVSDEWDRLSSGPNMEQFLKLWDGLTPPGCDSFLDAEALVRANTHSEDLGAEIQHVQLLMRYPLLADWCPDALQAYMCACPPQIVAYIASFRDTLEDAHLKRYYKFLCDAANPTEYII